MDKKRKIPKYQLLNEVQRIFNKENTVLIELEKHLEQQLISLESELIDIRTELEEKKAKISYKQCLPYLTQAEYDMLKGISNSKTKSEIYRKYFKNSSPYDIKSWKIINELEDLYLVKVTRDDSSAVKSIRSLI